MLVRPVSGARSFSPAPVTPRHWEMSSDCRPVRTANSFSPASVTCVSARLRLCNPFRGASSFSPASDTAVCGRSSVCSAIRGASACSPASVTLLWPRLSDCRPVSAPTSFSPASVTCVSKRVSHFSPLMAASGLRSASVILLRLKYTPMTGLPGALSSRLNVPPRAVMAFTAWSSASSARRGAAASSNAPTARVRKRWDMASCSRKGRGDFRTAVRREGHWTEESGMTAPVRVSGGAGGSRGRRRWGILYSPTWEVCNQKREIAESRVPVEATRAGSIVVVHH